MNQYFTGFIASLTVYFPTVKYGQISKSYISIQSTWNQHADATEEIQAEWVVRTSIKSFKSFVCKIFHI